MTSAQELDNAMLQRTPIGHRADVDETIDSAYERQDEFVRLRAERTGSRIVGYKAALTNHKPRIALGSDTPASGVYLDGDLIQSGLTRSLGDFFKPILEVELVLRVNQDLFGAVSIETVVAATDVAIGIEIPDSRFANWFGGQYPSLRLTEVVGDNCLAGALLVGEEWVPSAELDFSAIAADLVHNGEVVRRGLGTEVEPSPVHIVQWLATHLDSRGQYLKAGDVISTGTLTETIVAEPGRYTARSAGLGTADITFEG